MFSFAALNIRGLTFPSKITSHEDKKAITDFQSRKDLVGISLSEWLNCCNAYLYLIRRRQRPGLLKFHFLATASDRAFASLGTEHLSAANLAFKSFTQLIHKAISSFISLKPSLRGLFFQLHWLTTASYCTLTTLGNNKL